KSRHRHTAPGRRNEVNKSMSGSTLGGRATKALVSRSKQAEVWTNRLVQRRSHMALWFASFAASMAVVSLTTGGIMLVLGRRFIEEFTRPGVTVEQGTPQWGGWTFPELVVEPPTALQRALTFQSADGVLLRGEF